MAEDIELRGKLKLDTSEAEAELGKLAAKTQKSRKAKSEVKLDGDAQKSLKELFTGKDGLKNIGKLARDATTGVRGLANGLGGMASQAGKLGGALAIAAAAIALLVKLLQDTDTLKAIAEQLKSLFNEVQKLLAPLISLLGDIIIVLLQMVKDILPVLQPLVDNLAVGLKLIAGTLKILEPIVWLLGKAFELLYNVIRSIVKTITFGLIDLGNISGSTTGLKSQDGYKTSLDVWETSTNDVQDVNIVGMDRQVMSGLADKIQGGVKSAADWYSDAVVDVLSAVDNTARSIIEDALIPTTEIISEGVHDAVEGVIDFVESAPETIVDHMQNIGEKVAEGNIGGALAETVRPITDIVITAGQITEDVTEAVVDGLMEGAQDAKEAVNTAADTVKDVVAAIFGKGWLWEKGGTLPLFANGGEVGAQIWGMSEKGNPEFLFNSGGYNSVINDDILEAAMYRAVSKAMQEQNSKELKVSVREGTPSGPRELAQWLLPSLKFALG